MSSAPIENVGPLIIAIDGPSGVGKSTVARELAKILGVPYLSTGAMYRALALKVLEGGIDPENRQSVESLAESFDLQLEPVGPTLRVRLDGRDPGRSAYTLEVSTVTSKISTYPGVRRRMVELQRVGAQKKGAVLEGRDIGTRVFPESPDKFFLEASPETRAERRWLQLGEAEQRRVDREHVLREVVSRDERDTTRSESPLTKDASYRVIDTDGRSVGEVVDEIVTHIKRRLATEAANR